MQACAAFLHKPVHFRVFFLLLDKYFVPHLHHHYRNDLIYNELKEKLATLMGGGSLSGGLGPTLNKLVAS
jgi:hypothetical protein